jgi:arylsulfatase A-like enzyme
MELTMKHVPWLLVTVVLLAGDANAAEQSAQPNIVFILADDLGWADTTLYGHTQYYKTPHVERLARRGMTFTRAYSASPLCSPTRASILTGLSPARTGITSPACHLPQIQLEAQPGKQGPPQSKVILPSTATRLKTEYYTLAEALRDAGYATGHFGKWHLGAEPYSPLEHGFDVDVPHWPGPGPAGSYVAPWKFPDFDPDVPSQHIEDRMAKEAVAFIERHCERPFFLNYWMFSVHAPFDAKQSLIEKYSRQVDNSDAQRSPTYAAMIESMDDAVGTLLDTLDRLDLAERTIVVFFSDNGGNMYDEVDGTTPTSNRPLRGGKATIFEGGVRVPCVIIWPDVVAGGTRSDTMIESSDFYPTILDMLNLEPRPDQQFDGMSIVPALRAPDSSLASRGSPRSDARPLASDERAIFTYFPHQPRVPDWLPPSVAVHQGDWKLIRIFHGGENGAHRWKLFHLASDIGEKNDLAAREPKRLQTLDELINRFLASTQAVVPMPNPDFDPAVYRPQDEGKPGLRKPRKPAASAARGSAPSKPIAGWKPSGDCTLALQDGSLVITSLGSDPYLSYELPEALPAGQYALDVVLASKGRGQGQLFWQKQGIRPPFFRDRSTTFAVTHDGAPHTYRIAFVAAHPVTAIRIDPGQAAGEIRVSKLQLRTADREQAFEWKFDSPAADLQ